MKDWQDIRKTDEEFLEDIYERASQYEEEKAQQDIIQNKGTSYVRHRVRHKIYMTLSAAATVTVVLLGATKMMPLLIQDQGEDVPESIQYQKLQEERSLPQDCQKENVTTAVLPIRIEGTVESVIVQDNDNDVILKVNLSKSQEVNGETYVEVILSTNFYEQLVEYGQRDDASWLVNQNVSLNLEEYQGTQYYKLVNDDELYLQYRKSDGETVYRNLYEEEMNDDNEG